MKRFATLVLLTLVLWAPSAARAFCGFYVARADAQLFNKASQVVLVRDGQRTVLTMANDYRGPADDFAVVIPVPTFIEREQIHVAEQRLVDHLDAYTAPRLVEYFDENPCRPRYLEAMRMRADVGASPSVVMEQEAKREGVVIEAKYTVGEYDILILSAEQSDGLVRWLRDSGYRLPEGAEPVVRSYLRQGMRFFVARVNLAAQERLGFSNLRPLQVAYESRKFMLPIRLGTVNADGPQDLLIYTLTREGRVETANYRTVKLPTGMDLPTFVKDDFGRFYQDLFSEQVRRERMRAVFLEYAWDMAWCDPCAADPLSAEDLRQLGVFWLDGRAASQGPAQNVFVTRLHVRYDSERFPDDLVFHQTQDRSNFQGRYVLRHPWTGEANCREAPTYYNEVAQRQSREAETLASLTGWDIREVRDRMAKLPDGRQVQPVKDDEPWWRKLWPGR